MLDADGRAIQASGCSLFREGEVIRNRIGVKVGHRIDGPEGEHHDLLIHGTGVGGATNRIDEIPNGIRR